MSYQQRHDVYADPTTRDRALMCIREQAHIYVNDGRKDIAELGKGVIRGNYTDTQAIWSAVATGPNYAALENDLDLLSAVQSVWPAVAAVLYGYLVEEPLPER